MKVRVFNIEAINSSLKMGLFIFTMNSFWGSSNIFVCPNSANVVLTFVGIICLLCSIFKRRYNYKTIFVYSLLILLGASAYYVTRLSLVLVLILSCLAIRHVDFDSVCSFLFHYNIIFFIIHCFFLIATLPFRFTDYIVYSVDRTRFNFGFLHANLFSIYILNITLMWLWLNRRHISNRIVIMASLILLSTSMLSKTRTLIVTMVMILLLLCLVRIINRNNLFLSICSGYGAVLFYGLFFFFWQGFVKSNSLVIYVDNLLSARIRQGAYVMSQYGFSFLGQSITRSGIQWDSLYRLTDFTFDDIYSYFSFNIGLIWFILLVMCIRSIAKKKNNWVNVYIIIWLILGITDVHVLSCYVCFVALFPSRAFQAKDNHDSMFSA